MIKSIAFTMYPATMISRVPVISMNAYWDSIRPESSEGSCSGHAVLLLVP